MLLIGCDSANARLADLPGLRVTVGTLGGGLHVDDARLPTPTSITVGYTASFRADGDECAVIDASASIDGVNLPLSDAGGASNSPDGGCEFPTFEGPFVFETGRAHQIVVDDDAVRVVGDYAAEALEPPFATLTSQPTWTFGAGAQVVFRWSRAVDVAPVDPTFSVRYQGDELGGDNHINLPLDVIGDEVHVQFPSPLPAGVSTPGKLMFLANTKTGPSVSCTGANACTYAIERNYWRKTELE